VTARDAWPAEVLALERDLVAEAEERGLSVLAVARQRRAAMPCEVGALCDPALCGRLDRIIRERGHGYTPATLANALRVGVVGSPATALLALVDLARDHLAAVAALEELERAAGSRPGLVDLLGRMSDLLRRIYEDEDGRLLARHREEIGALMASPLDRSDLDRAAVRRDETERALARAVRR
jgi:hypothetical protein